MDSKGLSGGVAFLWKNLYNASVGTYSYYHISLQVTDNASGGACLVTDFYGNPLTTKRKDS